MAESASNKPRQIPLDLPWPRHDRATRADLAVSDSNVAAVGFLDNLKDWPEGRLALVGPEGCGKTHLAMIWAQEVGAQFIDGGGIEARDIATSGRVIFEDCDRRVSTSAHQQALFHLLNILREEGGSILMTARTPPSRWAITLPDLASRLSAVTTAEIHSPDDDLLEMLVAKLFADRDILVKEPLVSYIARRIDRNAAAAEAVVASLDAKSLEVGAPINMKLAKELFGW